MKARRKKTRVPRKRRTRSTYNRTRRAPSTSSTTVGWMRPDARGGGSMLDPGQKFALLQIDPFEFMVFGGKIPDSNTVPSCAVSSADLFPINLTTGTNMKCYAYPASVTWSQVAAIEGAGAWSWPALFAGATNYSKRTDYTNTYELDRPVAHGVRISSGVAPTDAAGFVHIAIGYESLLNESTWPFPTTPTGLAGYQWYKRVSLASLTQTPLTVCNKYVDETAFRYRASNTEPIYNASQGSFQTGTGWGVIFIAVEGGAAGVLNPVNLEWVLHTEAVPKASGVASGSPAAPFNSTVMSGTSNMVANADLTHTEINQSQYVSQAMSNFQSAVSDVGQRAYNEYIVPAAGRFANAAVYGAYNYATQRYGISGVNNNPNRLALN